MAELEAFCRGLECDPRVLDATPFGGFSYGDSAVAGAGAMVFTDDDPALARTAAERVVAEMRRRLDRFYITLPTAAEGIAAALASPRTPVAVIDSGDNSLSGGIADTPEMLRALLAAQPAVPVVFAFFADAPLVARCVAAGQGRRSPACSAAASAPNSARRCRSPAPCSRSPTAATPTRVR